MRTEVCQLDDLYRLADDYWSEFPRNKLAKKRLANGERRDSRGRRCRPESQTCFESALFCELRTAVVLAVFLVRRQLSFVDSVQNRTNNMIAPNVRQRTLDGALGRHAGCDDKDDRLDEAG